MGTQDEIEILGGKNLMKQVNRCEMFDLGVTEEEEQKCQEQEEENSEEDKAENLQLYQPTVAQKRDMQPHHHPYNLRSREQKQITSKTVLMTTWL